METRRRITVDNNSGLMLILKHYSDSLGAVAIGSVISLERSFSLENFYWFSFSILASPGNEAELWAVKLRDEKP